MSLSWSFTGVRERESFKKAIFSPNTTMNTSEHERLRGKKQTKKNIEMVIHPFTLRHSNAKQT